MNQPDARIVVGLWLAIAVLVVGALCYFFTSEANASTKRRVYYIGTPA